MRPYIAALWRCMENWRPPAGGGVSVFVGGLNLSFHAGLEGVKNMSDIFRIMSDIF